MHPHDISARSAAVVTEQLRLYNEKALDAYCRLYSDNATISTISSPTPLASGRAEIYDYFRRRFAESPNLQCVVLSRLSVGNIVVDHERVTGIDDRPLEVIAIYEVMGQQIASLVFAWPAWKSRS